MIFSFQHSAVSDRNIFDVLEKLNMLQKTVEEVKQTRGNFTADGYVLTHDRNKEETLQMARYAFGRNIFEPDEKFYVSTERTCTIYLLI